MPRKFFRKYLPSHEAVRQNRYIARFGTLLHHPNLWHLNRHSVAGGVAIGMFAGLVPGPFQMLIAAIAANAKYSASHPAPGNSGWCCSSHTPNVNPNAANLIGGSGRSSFRD